MDIIMKVAALSLDKISGAPLLILQEELSTRSLVIPISIFEAATISTELEKLKFTRPLPHDLILNFLTLFNARLQKVKITDFSNDIFFAELFFIHQGKHQIMDIRPSDAIVLALKKHCPIYANSEIFSKKTPFLNFLDSEKKDFSEEQWAQALDKKVPHSLQ